MQDLSKVDAVILAGGLGTRLQKTVPGKQKVIAEVLGRPFIFYLLDQLVDAGVKRVILATYHLDEQVKSVVGENYRGAEIIYSKEEVKLGTGGALRNAIGHIKSETVLVMNGDSFCGIDLIELYNWYSIRKPRVTMVVTKVSDSSRFGSVTLGEEGEVLNFKEKTGMDGEGFINAGIYLVESSLVRDIPENQNLSLENQVFPEWIGKTFYAYPTTGKFLDIGTQFSYEAAEKFFNNFTVSKKKRFVLLDRDGTLIYEKNYLSDPNQIELIPGTVEALRKLRQSGFGIILVTNQSGIGRGYFDHQKLELIHEKLREILKAEGVIIDDIYFCPHSPEDNCMCRKPKTKMAEDASKKHDFSLEESFVIGDNIGDILLGKSIGAKTILVKTGYGRDVEQEIKNRADFIADDLLGAAAIILKNFPSLR